MAEGGPEVTQQPEPLSHSSRSRVPDLSRRNRSQRVNYDPGQHNWNDAPVCVLLRTSDRSQRKVLTEKRPLAWATRRSVVEVMRGWRPWSGSAMGESRQRSTGGGAWELKAGTGMAPAIAAGYAPRARDPALFRRLPACASHLQERGLPSVAVHSRSEPSQDSWRPSGGHRHSRRPAAVDDGL
jgi:hypothetical protein